MRRWAAQVAVSVGGLWRAWSDSADSRVAGLGMALRVTFLEGCSRARCRGAAGLAGGVGRGAMWQPNWEQQRPVDGLCVEWADQVREACQEYQALRRRLY